MEEKNGSEFSVSVKLDIGKSTLNDLVKDISNGIAEKNVEVGRLQATSKAITALKDSINKQLQGRKISVGMLDANAHVVNSLRTQIQKELRANPIKVSAEIKYENDASGKATSATTKLTGEIEKMAKDAEDSSNKINLKAVNSYVSGINKARVALSGLNADASPNAIAHYNNQIDRLSGSLAGLIKYKGDNLSQLFRTGNVEELGKVFNASGMSIEKYRSILESVGNTTARIDLSAAKQLDAINKQFIAGDAQKNWVEQFNKLSNVKEDTLKGLRNGLAGISEKWKEINSSEFNKMPISEKLQEMTSLVENFNTLFDNATSENKTEKMTLSQLNAYTGILNKAQQYYQSNLARISQMPGLDARFQNFFNTLENNPGSFSGPKQAALQLQELQVAARGAGAEVDTLGTKITTMLKATVGSYLIYTAISAIKKALSQLWVNVKELDAALTQISIVTNTTGKDLEDFSDRAYAAATRVASSISSIMKSTETYARLGYNLADSLQLSELTNIYANIADTDITAATDSVTSVLKGFGLEADETEHVLDVMTKVGQEFPISASEIGEALQRSAAGLKISGTSFEKSVAIMAAGNASVQDAGKVGTAINTTSMRIRGAKSELEDAGLDTDGMATSVSKLRKEILALSGVDIMKKGGKEFKDIYDILLALGEVFPKLDDVTRANVLELIAGKRNANVIASVINNIEDLEKAYAAAGNSAGTLDSANEKYLDSIEGRTNQLSAASSEFSTNLLDSEAISTAIFLITKLVEALAALAGAFSGIGASALVGLTVGIGKFAMSMNTAKTSLLGMLQPLTTLRNTGMAGVVGNNFSGEQILAYQSALSGLNVQQQNAMNSALGLDRSQKQYLTTSAVLSMSTLENTLQLSKLNKEEWEALFAKNGITVATNAETITITKDTIAKIQNALASKDLVGADRQRLQVLYELIMAQTQGVAASEAYGIAQKNLQKGAKKTGAAWGLVSAAIMVAISIYTKASNAQKQQREADIKSLTESARQELEVSKNAVDNNNKLIAQYIEAREKTDDLTEAHRQLNAELQRANDLIDGQKIGEDINVRAAVEKTGEFSSESLESFGSFWQTYSQAYLGGSIDYGVSLNPLNIWDKAGSYDIDEEVAKGVKKILGESSYIEDEFFMGYVPLSHSAADIVKYYDGVVKAYGYLTEEAKKRNSPELLNSGYATELRTTMDYYNQNGVIDIYKESLSNQAMLYAQDSLAQYLKNNTIENEEDYEYATTLGYKFHATEVGVTDEYWEYYKDAWGILMEETFGESLPSATDLLIEGFTTLTEDIEAATEAKKKFDEAMENKLSGPLGEYAEQWRLIKEYYDKGMYYETPMITALQNIIPREIIDLYGGNYKQVATDFVSGNNAGLWEYVFSNDDEYQGARFVEYLAKNNADEWGNIYNSEGEYVADINQRDDGSYSFSYSEKLAEYLGISKEVLSAIMLDVQKFSGVSPMSAEDLTELMGIIKGWSDVYIKDENGFDKIDAVALISRLKASKKEDGQNYTDDEIYALINTLENSLEFEFPIGWNPAENPISGIPAYGTEEWAEFYGDKKFASGEVAKGIAEVLSEAMEEAYKAQAVTSPSGEQYWVLIKEPDGSKAEVNKIDVDVTVWIPFDAARAPNAGGYYEMQARSKGTKHAKAGPAVVNEEGAEIILGHDGAYIANGGEPAVVNLNSGDTVFNADETAEMMNGRGSIPLLGEANLKVSSGYSDDYTGAKLTGITLPSGNNGSGGKGHDYEDEMELIDHLISAEESLLNYYEEGSEKWIYRQKEVIQLYSIAADMAQAEYDRLLAEGKDATDETMREVAESVLDYQEKLFSEAEKLWEAQRENAVETLEHLSNQMQAVVDLKEAYFDLYKSIRQEQRELDNQRRIAVDAYPNLSDAEKEAIFSDEDYTALSDKLTGIMDEAGSMYEDYLAQIKNVGEDATYELEHITDEFERQYELKMGEYEVAKNELAVLKAQKNLQNVMNERNFAMLINGVWSWVADPEEVKKAMEDLSDAEIDLEEAEFDKEHADEIAILEGYIGEADLQIDAINELVFSMDSLANEIHTLVDTIFKQVQGILGFEYIEGAVGDFTPPEEFSNTIDDLSEAVGEVSFSSSDAAKLYAAISANPSLLDEYGYTAAGISAPNFQSYPSYGAQGVAQSSYDQRVYIGNIALSQEQSSIIISAFKEAGLLYKT